MSIAFGRVSAIESAGRKSLKNGKTRLSALLLLSIAWNCDAGEPNSFRPHVACVAQLLQPKKYDRNNVDNNSTHTQHQHQQRHRWQRLLKGHGTNTSKYRMTLPGCVREREWERGVGEAERTQKREKKWNNKLFDLFITSKKPIVAVQPTHEHTRIQLTSIRNYVDVSRGNAPHNFECKRNGNKRQRTIFKVNGKRNRRRRRRRTRKRGYTANGKINCFQSSRPLFYWQKISVHFQRWRLHRTFWTTTVCTSMHYAWLGWCLLKSSSSSNSLTQSNSGKRILTIGILHIYVFMLTTVWHTFSTISSSSTPLSLSPVCLNGLYNFICLHI